MRSLTACALGYHLKTGHQLSLQNRPTEHTQDQMMLYRAGGQSGKCFLVRMRVRVKRQGDRARGISAERIEIPLAGGAGARIVTALLAGTRRVPAWGEPSPPGCPWGRNIEALTSILTTQGCTRMVIIDLARPIRTLARSKKALAANLKA
jgi:hypothetical protein